MPTESVGPSSALTTLVETGQFQAALTAYHALPSGTSCSPEATLSVAIAAARLARWPLARKLAGSALRGFTRRADDDGAMRAANLLGADAIETGRLQRATRWFTRAHHLAERLNDRLMMARTGNNLASVALLLGRAAAARQRYHEALLAYEQLGDRRGAAETYHNLAVVSREEGRMSQARDASDHAVRHALNVGEPGLLALTMTGRAETAVLLGDHALARHELDRATAYATAAHDPIGLAEIDRVHALSLWTIGEFQKSLDAAERAVDTARTLGSALLLGESAALAARALERMGQPQAAASRWHEAQHQFARLGARSYLKRLPPAYQHPPH